MDTNECMTVADAARELGLSKSRLEQLIACGKLEVAGRVGTVRLVLKTRVAELKAAERPPGRPRKPKGAGDGEEEAGTR